MYGDKTTPPTQDLRQEIAHRCPGVAAHILDDVFSHFDSDYFTLFTAPQIAAHISLLAALDSDHPVQVRVVPRNATSAEILLAGYDFFGEFSIITGTMAAYGLNIVEGQVFSFRSSTESHGSPHSGLIVDLFTVEANPVRPFHQTTQRSFIEQLTALMRLLQQGNLQQARDALNDRLIATVRLFQKAFSARLFPVEVEVDNDTSPEWTIVHVSADDTPGFLYSLSNALSMRQVYIHRVIIRSHQGKVHDQLFLRWRRGGKITSAEGQRELRLMVVLIKQFTHFLTMAPNPVMALQHFDQFIDRLATGVASGEELHWLLQEQTLQGLAILLGSSNFLWEDFLRMQHMTLLPVLKNLREADRRHSQEELASALQGALHHATTMVERKKVLNTFKDGELFRIDLRHLLHPELPFGLFADELSDLAEVVLRQALAILQEHLQQRYGQPRLADGRPCAVALFALGKLGGKELGYASDIEMLCVYDGAGSSSGPQSIAVSEYMTLLVQQMLDLIVARRDGIFELDLRLRPFGSHGPLASSYEAFREYYDMHGQAAPFERQALIKLRWVAGDARLGQAVEAWRDAYVYAPTVFSLEDVVPLRQRQIDELTTPGTVDAKYSRGGLVEVEYTVQYLQVMHGHALPTLRTPHTLDAIEALLQSGILSAMEARLLREAYQFLRRLIDALRVVRGNARDLVLPPADSAEFTFLARRLGYWEDGGTPAQLAQDIALHMQQAARIYDERFR